MSIQPALVFPTSFQPVFEFSDVIQPDLFLSMRFQWFPTTLWSVQSFLAMFRPVTNTISTVPTKSVPFWPVLVVFRTTQVCFSRFRHAFLPVQLGF
jgi:hypothetical protein